MTLEEQIPQTAVINNDYGITESPTQTDLLNAILDSRTQQAEENQQKEVNKNE